MHVSYTVSDARAFMCDVCGAAVVNLDRHREWHMQLETAFVAVKPETGAALPAMIVEHKKETPAQ